MAAKKTGKPVDRIPNITTTINLPVDLFELVDDAARARAKAARLRNAALPKGQKIGTSRPSVSAVIVAILDAHRDEIKKMTAG